MEGSTMTRRHWLAGTAGLLGLGVFASGTRGGAAAPGHAGKFEVELTPEQWRAKLTPEQYRVLREEATERAGSSPLDREKRPGLFHCAGCDLPLYSSTAKFDSGTGWPSFFQPLPNAVATREDSSFFMTRTEVHCRRCGGHLGHVFDDGPRPTGLRYCMNGAALVFKPGATEPAK
jgi:peptide-methionine (R)-S-oxide reductase